MTNSSQGAGPSAPDSAYLKAWEGYAEACQALFVQALDVGSTVGGMQASVAMLAPWKDFADRIGMAAWPGEPSQGLRHLFTTFGPSLGHTREYQELGQRLVDLTLRFQRRYAEFLEQGARVTRDAALLFRERRPGSLPTGSPLEEYDAWIDAAEAAYGQLAHTEAFALLLADLCNIVSEFKIERGRLLERIARHLDLPSRSEVDSLHGQVRLLAMAVRNRPPEPARRTSRVRTRSPPKRKPGP